MQQHWAAKIEPALTAFVGFLLVLFANAIAPRSLGTITDLAWWLWFLLLLRAGWELLNWRVSWFIATDQRLLLLYGIITTRVAMMPLSKVTDMSYSRSPLGRLLGYGTFTLESAGQDQALQQITFVRDPDRTYRAICQEIFGTPRPRSNEDDDDSGYDDRGDDTDSGRGSDGDGPGGPDDGPSTPTDLTDVPVQRLGSYLMGSGDQGHGRRSLRRRRRSGGDDDPGEPPIPGIISRDDDLEAADPRGFDDSAGWQVSREDASPREEVPRRNAGWWD